MAREFVKIELNQKDIGDMVAQKWGLDSKSLTISITHYDGDMREPSYTSVVVVGKKVLTNNQI